MAPKTHFTVPLNKAADPVVPTQRGRRTTRTTEKIPLGHLPKRGVSSKASSSLQVKKDTHTVEDVQVEDTVEIYPLQDADDVEDIPGGNTPSNVSSCILTRTVR
jgi:hypothetical protein